MDTKQLALTAAKARLLGLDMVYGAASGHLGGSFSAMDLLTVLYQNVMQVDPADPSDPDRDRFVLSKGHCTPALYPTLALRGYFPTEELKLFRSVNGPHVRPCGNAPCQRGGYVHRQSGTGDFRRRRHGPGR